MARKRAETDPELSLIAELDSTTQAEQRDCHVFEQLSIGAKRDNMELAELVLVANLDLPARDCCVSSLLFTEKLLHAADMESVGQLTEYLDVIVSRLEDAGISVDLAAAAVAPKFITSTVRDLFVSELGNVTDDEWSELAPVDRAGLCKQFLSTITVVNLRLMVQAIGHLAAFVNAPCSRGGGSLTPAELIPYLPKRQRGRPLTTLSLIPLLHLLHTVSGVSYQGGTVDDAAMWNNFETTCLGPFLDAHPLINHWLDPPMIYVCPRSLAQDPVIQAAFAAIPVANAALNGLTAPAQVFRHVPVAGGVTAFHPTQHLYTLASAGDAQLAAFGLRVHGLPGPTPSANPADPPPYQVIAFSVSGAGVKYY